MVARLHEGASQEVKAEDADFVIPGIKSYMTLPLVQSPSQIRLKGQLSSKGRETDSVFQWGAARSSYKRVRRMGHIVAAIFGTIHLRGRNCVGFFFRYGN